MSAMLDYMQLCRLCLVKEKVNVPIFDEQSDVRQIYLKISACLPVKISRDDSLPKNICDSCCYKVDLLYQFWNTTVNAEKQLTEWLGNLGVDISKTAGTTSAQHSTPAESIVLKQENHDPPEVQNVEQIPEFLPSTQIYTNYNQQFASSNVPNDNLNSSVNNEPAKVKRRGRPPGSTKKKPPPATQTSTNTEDESNDEGSTLNEPDLEDSDESMEDGKRIAKEEQESDLEYEENEALEPTTFVGVTSETPCDTEQPGPSGLNKPATITASEAGILEFGDQLKNALNMEPIVTIVELSPDDWELKENNKTKKNWDESYFSDDVIIKEEIFDDSEDEIIPSTQNRTRNERYALRHRGTRPSKQKNYVYKNPFVYDTFKKEKVKKEKAKLKEQKEMEKTKSKWSCLICNETLQNKKELIDHYAAHKDDKIKKNITIENEVYQCHICLKEFTSEKRYEKHYELHNDTRYNCDCCEKTFKRPYDLAIHSKFHSNNNKMKCHVCDFTTSYNSAMQTHIKRHESEYKYKCELCGKGFFCSTWYEEHKNFHSGDKPFTCDLCGKQFAYTRYMMAHKRSMHPETFTDAPVVNECNFCQKRFAHRKSLLLHIRSHTGENTVLCDICGKSLSSNDHLNLHRRIHTGYKPYACSVCGKAFSKKCNLTLHERVHSGEKPYVCDVCGKCFSQRSTLVIHNRYHTGQRPYVCHLCNKGFVAKGVLGIHIKSCNRHNIMGHYLDSLK